MNNDEMVARLRELEHRVFGSDYVRNKDEEYATKEEKKEAVKTEDKDTVKPIDPKK